MTKTSPDDICPKPKNIYKVYKLYNVKQFVFPKHRKKCRNQILKLLNYKDLFTEKNLNLKTQSNKICKKTKEKMCLLSLCDLFKLIFSTPFEKDIE